MTTFMIKLTINPYQEATCFIFDQSKVTIGGKGICDLSLKPFGLEAPVELLQEEGHFFLYNPSKNSTVSFNGKNIDKEEISPGFIFNIAGHEILFETHDPSFSFSDHEIDRLLENLDNDISFVELPHMTHSSDLSVNETLPIQSLPYMKSPALKSSASIDGDKNNFFKRSFFRSSTFLILIGVLLFGSGSIVGGYRLISHSNRQKETTTVKVLSDLMIAFTHSRLRHENKSLEHLLSTLEINAHLQTVLPSIYLQNNLALNSSLSSLKDYTLKVLSTSDNTHTLIFALPKLGWLQALFPKNTLLVDSKLLSVRAIDNLKPWEKLLSGAEHLDSYSFEEVSNLCYQALPISLSSINYYCPNEGFALPQALLEKDPETDILIHNAPRYFSLTKPLYERALQIRFSNQEDFKQIANLLHVVNSFSCLPHLVIYSPDGLDGAAAAWKGLSRFAPMNHFLIGYIYFNDSSGLIETQGFPSLEEITLRAQLQDEKLIEQSVDSLIEGHPNVSDASLPFPQQITCHHTDVEKEQTLLLEVAQIRQALENRSELWQKLLSTEHQLCQIPQMMLDNVLTESDSPLKRFSENSQRLSSLITSQEDFLHRAAAENTPFEWRQQQKERLLEIVINAQGIENDCLYLQKETTSYLSRLRNFIIDLKQAKEEGFYFINRAHHHVLLNDAQQKLKRAEKMIPYLQDIAERIGKATVMQEKIAMQELMAFEVHPLPPLEMIARLQEELTQLNAIEIESRELQKLRR